MFRFFYRYYQRCAFVGILLLIGASLCFNWTITAFCSGFFLLIVIPVCFASVYGNHCVRVYIDSCDPEPLLDLALWNIRRYQKAKFPYGKAARRNAYFNAVAALSDLGRYREAIGYLDTIDRASFSPDDRVLYWLDRFIVLLSLGETPEELERLLSLAEESMKDGKAARARQGTLQRVFQHAKILLLIQKEGPTQESTLQLEQCLTAATTEKERVGIHLSLGRSKLELGERETALEHLNYVIDHGNKLYARVRAEEMLASLEKNDSPTV